MRYALRIAGLCYKESFQTVCETARPSESV